MKTTDSITTFQETVRRFAGLLAQRDIKVVFRGDSCVTDGKTIMLPAIDLLKERCETDEVKALLALMVGFVNHEVGHVCFTDFNLKVEEKRLKIILNVLEDGFVERRMCSMWTGADQALHHMMLHVIKKDTSVYSDPNKDRFMQLMFLLTHAVRGDRYAFARKLFSPNLVAWVDATLTDEIREAMVSTSTQENLALAERILAKIKAEADREQQEQKNGDESGDESAESDEGENDEGENDESENDESENDESENDESENDESENDESENDESENGDEDGTSEGDGEADGTLLGDDQEIHDTKETIAESVREEFKKLTKGLARSELKYTPYTTQHDAIVVMERNGPVSSWPYGDLHAARKSRRSLLEVFHEIETLASEVAPMQQTLARVLKAKGMAYTVRDLESGTLDRRRLWKVANHARMPGQPNVYKQTVQHDINNVAVFIMVDQSGSMEHGNLIPQAAAAALALGDTMQSLRIPFAIAGHSTGSIEVYDQMVDEAQKAGVFDLYTRFGPFYVEYVKTFAQAWPSRRTMVGGICPQHANYDGEAVRVGMNALLKQPYVNRRILMVLSDGLPAPEYCNKRQRSLAEKDLHDAVKEATEKGVEILGVGMQCDTSQFYSNHLRVNSLSALPSLMLTALNDLITNTKKAG